MKLLPSVLCAALLLGTSTARASGAELPLLSNGAHWLAAAAPGTQREQRTQPAEVAVSAEEPPGERWFSDNKVHQYLGLGSLALATLAVLSPKDDDGAHPAFGQSAAALGLAAVGSGLVIHWDDLFNGGGLANPDVQHALLATLGALGYVAAISQEPDDDDGGGSHAVIGAGAFVAMAVGIRLTW